MHYIRQEVFITYVEINWKSSSAVVVTVPMKYGNYCEECQLDTQALERRECEKAAVYELLGTGMVGNQRKFLQGIMKKTSHA